MLHVQIDLNDVGTIATCTGYPCLGLPVIEAWRYLLTRGGGIQSSGISVHLHQSLNQVMLLGCDAFSAVDVEQHCEAVIDLLQRHSKLDQVINMVVQY
jgi:hypothetical protein